MKKVLTAVLGIGLVLTLSACKLEHNSKVKYTQLTGGVTTIEAMAKVEVPSCTDHKDKTKPSKYIEKTQSEMKQLFPDAEYEECKHENGIHSMMTFTVPMEVGTLPNDGKEPQIKGVALLRNARGEVFFCLSQNVRDKILNAKKNPLASKMALQINIRLTNDTDKSITLYPHAAYFDGHAFDGLGYWDDHVTLPAKNRADIRLSDVASDMAISQGLAPIFTEMKLMLPSEKK